MMERVPADQIVKPLADKYRVERELGSGGMATVYLAEDVRHNRKVALKVLHPELSAVLGPERFLKEIELTANLQHPHILPLFDSGSADGHLFYVMPFVDGESLRGRLEREKQLPIVDALRIATEVADALQYAHGRSVVHRDIKPENILLHGGHALVADFGIALAVQQAGGQRMTQTGLSLGTPQYMSPEQAMGERTIDARSDIYALGVVTYEMLAGEPPFTGPTAQAIVARVMSASPASITDSRGTVPAHVEQAILTALAKLPADRWSSAAAFAAALTQPDLRASARPGTRRAGHSTGVLVGVAVVALASGVFASRAIWPSRAREAAVVPVRHWTVPLPDSARFSPTSAESAAPFHGVAISSDAARIAYVGARGSSTALYLVELTTGSVTALDGTDRARLPVFSPDGRWLAFVADGELRKISVDGGAVVRLAPLEAPIGLFWLSDERLLVSQSAIGPGSVPSAGGRVEPLGARFLSTSVIHTQQLPGVKALLGTTAFGDLATISLETGELRFITSDDVGQPDRAEFGRALHGRNPRYLSNGYLVYGSGSSLMAVPFDTKSLRAKGKPISVATDIRSEGGPGEAQFAVSDDGTLVYAPGMDGSLGALVWSDQSGTIGDSLPLRPANLLAVRLSRDGRRVAVVERLPNGPPETRIVDLARRVEERVRFEGEVGVMSWSADGRRLMGYVIADTARGRACCFVGAQLDAQSLAVRLSDVQAPYHLVIEFDESPDGTLRCDAVTIDDVGVQVGGLLLRRVDNTASPRILAKAEFHGDCAFSPDGKWLAFTNRDGLYVTRTTLDSAASIVKLVPGASAQVRWTPDGRRLLYRDGQRLLAVGVRIRGDTVEGDEPRVLFEHNGLGTTWDVWGSGWDVARDGRLLLWQGPRQSPGSQLKVITNLPGLVAERVRAGLTTR